MPLNPATLISEILKVTDETNPDFVGWPTVQNPDNSINFPLTNQNVADNWATITERYFSEAIFPGVAPGTVQLAGIAMRSTVTSLLPQTLPSGPDPIGLIALDTGFKIFATTLAAGTVPPNTSLPPVAPGPVSTALGPPVGDPVVAATTLATSIDLWARTGLSGPAGAVVIPWG